MSSARIRSRASQYTTFTPSRANADARRMIFTHVELFDVSEGEEGDDEEEEGDWMKYSTRRHVSSWCDEGDDAS